MKNKNRCRWKPDDEEGGGEVVFEVVFEWWANPFAQLTEALRNNKNQIKIKTLNKY